MKSTFKILIVIIAIVIVGCCVEGSGDLVTETRRVEGFRSIKIDIRGDVVITKGDVFEMSIRTDDNLIDDITTEVRNDTLYLNRDPEYRCIDPTLMEITISMPELQDIKIDGSADIVIEDSFQAEEMHFTIDGSGDITTKAPLFAGVFDLKIDGTGDVKLELDVVELKTDVDGSADMTYSGFAEKHYVFIDGTSDMRAFDLETDITTITIDGSGSCEVNVVEELTVDIDGSGDVYYVGNPVVSQKIDGSGSVRDVN